MTRTPKDLKLASAAGELPQRSGARVALQNGELDSSSFWAGRFSLCVLNCYGLSKRPLVYLASAFLLAPHHVFVPNDDNELSQDPNGPQGPVAHKKE